VAIAIVSAFLKGKFDMDYELRPYVEFAHSTIYPDNQRVRITNNSDNNIFENNWGIELIDSSYYSTTPTPDPNDCFYTQFDPTEDGDEELILVKKPNTCPSEKLRVPIQTLLEGVENYKLLDNPDYNANCGVIVGTDGVFNNLEIINYYNTIYTTTVVDEENVYDISTIDYSGLSLVDISNYQTAEYFDQYLLSNQNRDFIADDRNVIIKQLVLDILVYTLVQRTAPRQISTMIQQRYDDALTMLSQLQRGELNIALKKYEGSLEFQNHISVRWGVSRSSLNQSY
jgi:phage gp36-like protein